MKHPILPLGAIFLALSPLSQGVTVTLNAGGDAAGTSSFNSGVKWSDALAPSAGKDYVVGVQFLRTPNGATGSYTFGGDSLAINTGGGLIYKGSGTTGVYTINNFILGGGLIRSGSSTADKMIFAGNMNVTGTGSIINADQSSFAFNSVVTGTGSMTATATNALTITFNGANTYTGNLTVSNNSGQTTGRTVLSSTSTWKFAVGANGVNNTISGAGNITLAGQLNIDLTSASTTVGDSWTLVNGATLAETYDTNFSIIGFTKDGAAAGARTWTKNAGSVFYKYTESNGVLSVTSNPDSDGDGLLDAWEITYFGNITAQGATGDPDTDGYDNTAEHTAGSNPALAASTPLDINADGITDGHIFGTSDPIGTASFNSGAGWKDGLAPAAGQNYLVPINNFRTPDIATDITFAGDKLVITTGGNIVFKGTGVVTIPYLGLDGGLLNNATNGNVAVNLAGAINVSRASEIWANNASFNVNAPISGTQNLTFSSSFAGRVVNLNAANTWTGNANVTGGLVLGSTGSLTFKPGASGTCNSVSGTGTAAFNGTFEIDLTTAATTIGSSWTLVDAATLTETYDTAFAINGFSSGPGSAGSRVWTKIQSGAYFQFSEITGILSVVNPDTDGDGLDDTWENNNFGNLDQTGTDDADADGATNEQEETAGTNPNLDTSWPDADADGLKDAWEISYFGNITAQGATGDPDGDLASNLAEFTANSDPKFALSWPDSDGDLMNDAWETAFFGDLTKDGTADTDADSYTDLEEHDAQTDPTPATGTRVSPIWATLAHRWSFNGDLNDSVGSSPATIVDVGANNVTYDDISTPTSIIMSGGAKAASDYIKLGTNLLPKSTTPVTIELWAKQNTIQNWSRIFDFHSGTTEELFMSWTRGTDNATDRTEIVDAGVVSGLSDKNQPYGTTDENHIVMTLRPLAGNNGTMRVTIYSAKSSAADLGPAKGSFDTAVNLVNFNDLINSLGYSPWADNTASATYNEVRLWNGALNGWMLEKLHDQGAENTAIPDTDGDFLPDDWELAYFPANTSAMTTLGDNDSDGANNREEYFAGSNPNSAASTPADVDGDGLTDTWEIAWFTNITAQNGSGDPDADTFTNAQELANGTDPTSSDNDGDGLSDVWETTWFGDATSQNGSGDPDGDTFNNELEETAGSNPTSATSIPGDTDGDGLLDTWETTWFGNITAQNGSGDPDADTFTNEQEETGKSNPTLASSIPGDINGDGLADGHLLIATDAFGTNSFITGLNWDDATAPTAGANYLVQGLNLRTPDDVNPYTFAGDHLVLGTTSVLIVKGTGALTIPGLGLDGGQLRNATSANSPFTLSGAISVTRASEIYPQNSGITIDSVVSGTKDLTIPAAAANAVTFNAANTWTGNLNVTGVCILGSTGTFTFKPAATTVTNTIAGAGTATFNGAFHIDLSSASNTVGDNWTLVSAATLTETYGAGFTVTGFTADAAAAGARKWTSASGNYQFDEATGTLTRIAPATNDTDGDGMDDTWENTWFAGLSQSATGDYDGDGTDNLTEYRLGLVPNSGNSRFAATSSTPGHLQWPSATGLTFTVKRSTTLQSGSWTTIATVPGTAGTASYTDPAPPAGSAFYQILLEP